MSRRDSRSSHDYDCFFLIANKHAFTTRADKPADIRQSVLDIAADWLSVGIDPQQLVDVHPVRSAGDRRADVLSLAMLIPFNRVMRNPTLASGDSTIKTSATAYPFGFPMYAVGQCADILAFRPELVPVGEDQIPHLELCREVTRKFNTTLLRRRSAGAQRRRRRAARRRLSR